jgi:hypothetical protein
VRIRRDDERARKRVSFFYEDLVPDSASGAVEIDTVRARKGFDRCVFLKVFWGFVLDVVVEGEDGLVGVVDFGGAKGFESVVS